MNCEVLHPGGECDERRRWLCDAIARSLRGRMGGSCEDGGRVGRPVSGCKARCGHEGSVGVSWTVRLLSAHDIGFFGLVVEASTQR